MKYLALIGLMSLTACSDVPRLTSPAEALADREAHNAYLESKYNAEFLADCAYYDDMEECQ